MKKTTARRRATKRGGPLPSRFQRFGREFPDVARAYEALGQATQAAGPLTARERALAKLGIAVGAWREGAVHAHTRRAVEAGCTAADIRHVVLLATTTLGFPSMMAAMTWVDDVLVG